MTTHSTLDTFKPTMADELPGLRMVLDRFAKVNHRRALTPAERVVRDLCRTRERTIRRALRRQHEILTRAQRASL